MIIYKKCNEKCNGALKKPSYDYNENIYFFSLMDIVIRNGIDNQSSSPRRIFLFIYE